MHPYTHKKGTEVVMKDIKIKNIDIWVRNLNASCMLSVPALRAGERGGCPGPPVGRGLTSPQDYYV
jgi:hypothetical protein